jgi:DNA-binding transcriptional regulator YhcF (GntR family)
VERKMTDKNNIEKELKKVQYLLAGLLLKRAPSVKEIAKIIECSNKTISKIYPDKKGGKNDR